jgi:hypothetical protein
MSEQEIKNKTNKSARFIKFTLITVLLGIAIIGLISVNLSSLREPIIKELSQLTNLSIEIESLNLNLFNGLRLQGGGLKVSSKDGANKIFSAQNLILDVELKPLMAGKLKIKKIVLVKPIISITFGSKAVLSNLLDIPKSIETNNQKINLEPNEVVKQKKLERKKSEIGMLESIRNLLKDQSLSLRSITIKDGEFLLSKPAGDLLFVKTIPIFLSAQLDITNPTSSQINIKGKLSHIVAGALNFKGTLEALDILEGLSPVKINIESTPFPISNIYSLIDTEAILNLPIVKFESGQVEKNSINLEGLINSSQNRLENIVIKNDFKISSLEFLIPENKNLEKINLSNINGEGFYQDGVLSYKINSALWNGTIQSDLKFNLSDLKTESWIESFNANTHINEIDLTSVEFKLPDQWKPTNGTITGSINVHESLNKKISNRKIYGKLEINNLSLGIESLNKIEQTKIRFSQKASQKTTTIVQLKNLILNNVLINTAKTKLKFSSKKISFSNGRIVLSNGMILFTGDYRPKLRTYLIHINGNDLRLEDLLGEKIEGAGLFSAMLQGNLITQSFNEKEEAALLPRIGSDLSGKLSFEFKDGAINPSAWLSDKLLSFPLLKSLSVTEQNNKLAFHTFSGEFKAWKGQITTDKFELKGPKINFTTLAAANLNTNKIAGEMKVTSINILDSVIKIIPFFDNTLKKDILSETYFRLNGTLKEPNFLIANEKSLSGEPTTRLENLVKMTTQN